MIMMDCKVSIITVCFNSEKTITRTLESVLNQTVSCFEYIIIDGKSTDRTLDILKSYEEQFNGKMKIISEPDNGIYDAMNKGISMASGDIIGIVNSDDYYEPDAIEIMSKEYDGTEHMVLYGIQRTLKNGKELRSVIFNHENLDNQMITHPTCFVTRKVYEDFGTFNLSYKSSADYEFMLRLFHNSDTRFLGVYKVVSNFELGGMSSSEKGYRETLKLKKNYNNISFRECFLKTIKSYIKEIIT